MIHGFIPPERFFAYLTWQEIEMMTQKEHTVIIQPIGAIEQHGYHLPLIVDSAISEGVLGKALSLLNPKIPAYALPTIYYGKSNEHDDFAGTISLSATTLYNLIEEMAISIYKAGFRKLILMNSHGGQPQIMEIVARDLHQKFPDLAVFPLFTWKVPNITNNLLTPQEIELGIHAGDAETSLMLALLPHQVKMDLAVKEYPRNLAPNTLLSMEGNLPFAWLTREVSKTGVMGDATVATKEKGDLILSSLAQSWVTVIEDVFNSFSPAK